MVYQTWREKARGSIKEIADFGLRIADLKDCALEERAFHCGLRTFPFQIADCGFQI
jgi:hypothetical protein